ncbi:hypothetical protein QUF64_02460 [Anaerolineales bacterium HSG6]|nr:hypothetical protein [Anaerolineales bacterium HSG6]MDM8532777.1 hypothetical protein [Anaerolineales bacterium HSG25]
MNRTETLEWIELILDSLDNHEMMAIIRESVGQFDGEFFEVMGAEIDRYKAEGNTNTANRLESIARAIASVRQNRAENI